MSCLRGWLLLGLLATPAWALPPVSVSFGYSAQVFSSRSFDLVAVQDHLQLARAGAGYSLQVWRGYLDLEVAFAAGATDAVSHGSLPSSLAMYGLEASAGFRYPWLKHLEPYLHIGAGWDWASLTLIDGSRLSQTVSNVSGNALIGAQIPFKLGPDDSKAPSLLMDLGLGYVVRPSAGFHAMAPGAGPRVEEPIAHAVTDLGSLPLSGISYRVLITCRL